MPDRILRLLLLLGVATLGGCVHVDEAVDPAEPGRHAREHAEPPRSEQVTVFDVLDAFDD